MPTAAELAAKLAALDEDFKAAPSESRPMFDSVPPGRYQATFREVAHFESKKNEDWFLKLIFEVMFEEHAGRSIDKIYNMGASGSAEQRQQRLGFLKQDLKTLGIDVDAEDFSISDCFPGSPLWDEILGTPVAIAVVPSKKVNPETGEPYPPNAYLNERLGDPLPTDIPVDPIASVAPAKPSYEDDDSVPF